MQNYFIINPAAVSKRKIRSITEGIKQASEKTGIKGEIYYTRYPGDSERFIRWMCDCYPGETFRFFGCGGDGTLNEIINGCVGRKNAVAGVLPTGTGNDFARYFGDFSAFESIEGQLNGRQKAIDVIRCKYIENGRIKQRYCCNMINIGFDSNVVVKTAEITRKGRFKGSFAYLLGVIYVLIKKKGANLKIQLDNGYSYDGPLLLTAICNGRYCGGGVKNSPFSLIDDGKIDVSVIRDISRFRFIRLFPLYRKGKHLPKLADKGIIDYNPARKVLISSNDEDMTVSNDGEIFYTNRLQLDVVPRSVYFSVPEGCKEEKEIK